MSLFARGSGAILGRFGPRFRFVELGVLPFGFNLFAHAPVVPPDADDFTFAWFLSGFFSLRGHGIILVG
jgi:hypothetical protein